VPQESRAYRVLRERLAEYQHVADAIMDCVEQRTDVQNTLTRLMRAKDILQVLQDVEPHEAEQFRLTVQCAIVELYCLHKGEQTVTEVRDSPEHND